MRILDIAHISSPRQTGAGRLRLGTLSLDLGDGVIVNHVGLWADASGERWLWAPRQYGVPHVEFSPEAQSNLLALMDARIEVAAK